MPILCYEVDVQVETTVLSYGREVSGDILSAGMLCSVLNHEPSPRKGVEERGLVISRL